MPQFFFHLTNGADTALHPKAIELPDEAVPSAALFLARDIMAGDVRDGRLNLHYRLDVHRGDDQLVHSLRFEDALQIVDETGAVAAKLGASTVELRRRREQNQPGTASHVREATAQKA